MISVWEVPLALVNQLKAYVQHQSPCSDVITNSLLVSTGQYEDLVPEGEEPDTGQLPLPHQCPAISFASTVLLVTSLVCH